MTYVALLRGINVGGRNLLPMSGLRDLFWALGFSGAQTLLQSGNVVFESTGRTATQLEQLLASETQKRFKIPVEYFIRTAKEWREFISRNPFRREATDDPSHLVVFFLKKAPAAKAVDALRAAIRGPETIEVDAKNAYIVYPDGIGRSKLTFTLLEKKLGSRGTGRNWNTVLKLLALSGQS